MKKFAIFFVLVGFACAGLVLNGGRSSADTGATGKIAPQVLDALSDGRSADINITLKTQADLNDARSFSNKEAKGQYVYDQLTQTASETQKEIISYLERENITYRSYWIVNSILVRDANSAIVDRLSLIDEVGTIALNPTVSAKFPESEIVDAERVTALAIEPNLLQVKADVVWAMGYTGQGTVVAGADTGYKWEHPNIKDNYRGLASDGTAEHNYNWFDAIDDKVLNNGGRCGIASLEPCGDLDHGTHTMGILVGKLSDIGNNIGMAPDAKWIACRNMDVGNGTLDTYKRCYQFFLAPHDLNQQNPDPSLAPHAVNDSWRCTLAEGCTVANFSELETVVNNLKAAGIVVVSAAGNSGNSGCSTIADPSAIYENAFTIGAVESADNLAGFSSRGPVTVDGSGRLKPNVSAPGRTILSSGFDFNYDPTYETKSGTSMATPHVTGLIALMISANPAIAGDVEAIETIIENSAEQVVHDDAGELCGGTSGTTFPNNYVGHGRIDAEQAVLAALAYTSTPTTIDLQSTNTETANTPLLLIIVTSGLCLLTLTGTARRLQEIRA